MGVDASFRLHSPTFCAWDQYGEAAEVLRLCPDVKLTLLEDTGKFWSTNEQKIGTLFASPAMKTTLTGKSRDLILQVSATTLQFVTGMVEEDVRRRDIGLPPVSREAVLANRRLLREALASADVSLEILNPDSRLGIEWLRLPQGWSAEAFNSHLIQHGVHVVPGSPFFWADHEAGDRYIRIALLRGSEFIDGLERLVRGINSFEPVNVAEIRLRETLTASQTLG